MEAVEGFSGLRLVVGDEVSRPSPTALLRALRERSVPRLELATEPKIYLHQRRKENDAAG
jgi:hypothetical protein